MQSVFRNVLATNQRAVVAMKSIPPGEIMCRVHIADQSDKTQATKGIDAWKYFLDHQYLGYNHVPNIVLPVNGLSASQLMTINRDGASQLLNVSPAKRFNELISQNQREESLPQVVQKTSRPRSGCTDPGDIEGRSRSLHS